MVANQKGANAAQTTPEPCRFFREQFQGFSGKMRDARAPCDFPGNLDTKTRDSLCSSRVLAIILTGHLLWAS
jgi:hypothetical protein